MQLAETIADEIARLIEQEQIPATGRGESGFRPVTPGDILILVQRRSELFHHLIRACKTRALPIGIRRPGGASGYPRRVLSEGIRLRRAIWRHALLSGGHIRRRQSLVKGGRL